MELHRANQLSELSGLSRREKNWLCREWDRGGRMLQEDRMRNLREVEELKKLRCNQALVTTAARVCHQGSLRWRKKEQRANKPWSHQRNSASQLRGAFSARRRRNVTRRGVAAYLKSASTQLLHPCIAMRNLTFPFGPLVMSHPCGAGGLSCARHIA